jgi:tRNA dimethylallyltransferase
MSANPTINLITILGHTAAGKTSFASCLASRIGGEIISADSRQVYRGMDIGTGKDLNDYVVEGHAIPYHLIDIVEPGHEYNIFEFRRDFERVYPKILERNRTPILCGGSGLYIESVLRNYRLQNVPVNVSLRNELEDKSQDELTKILSTYRVLHNTTDTVTRKRLLRAIEIEHYLATNPADSVKEITINPLVIGVKFDRESRRSRITERLKNRLDSGMIEEAEGLLKRLGSEKLIYYGLEYKYLTLYLLGNLSYGEMFESLNTAIHQFAKRQMTWFRGMEKRGIKINWIDGSSDLEEKTGIVLDLIINTLGTQANFHG